MPALSFAPSQEANLQRELLTPGEAAAHLTVTERALENYRRRGTGPVFRKLGRYVRYHRDDIAAWVAANARQSTRGN